MSKGKHQKIRLALGYKNYMWLLNNDFEDVAAALVSEIAEGGDPDEIGRSVADEIGETRDGMVNRIRSAARYLESQNRK